MSSEHNDGYDKIQKLMPKLMGIVKSLENKMEYHRHRYLSIGLEKTWPKRQTKIGRND